MPWHLALCAYTDLSMHREAWIEYNLTRRGTFQTLCRGNQTTIDTESELQSDCTNNIYSYQVELLYL